MWWFLTTALADPLDAVVFVQQGSSACAGTHLGDGVVLTAYHCIMRGGRPKITTREGWLWTGRIRRVDRRHDLALIDVPGMDLEHFLELGPTPAPGNTVRALGHPYGTQLPIGFMADTLRWSVSEGIVSALGTRAIQTTAPINPGNSGGPLIDEEDRVVGVVSRKLRGDGLGFAGRMDGREAWLKSPKRWLGIGGWIGTEVFVQANDTGALPISLGGRAVVELRDRVVFAVSGSFPLGARWQAIRGPVQYQPAEVRIALRQRLFRGSWSLRLDAYAALAVIETLMVSEDLAATTSLRSRPLLGGRIGARNLALEYGTTLESAPFMRMQIVLRWPGTLTIL